MSYSPISKQLRQQVKKKAQYHCEYCLLPDNDMFLPHQIDHIIAEQHGGETILENLALACAECNLQKGPNIASIDPMTKQITRLFNPRVDKWSRHFRLENLHIIPLTKIGRATVHLLKLNSPERLEVRKFVML